MFEWLVLASPLYIAGYVGYRIGVHTERRRVAPLTNLAAKILRSLHQTHVGRTVVWQFERESDGHYVATESRLRFPDDEEVAE